MTDLYRRDRFGRPYIKQPDGKELPYTRCTTYVGCLEDSHNLTQWKLRQVTIGLTQRSDLIALASNRVDDKSALNQIVTDAMDAANSQRAANLGTALHEATELWHSGIPLERIHPDHQADLRAYIKAIDGITTHQVEQPLVLDSLQIAGTCDRIIELPNGEKQIADLKTGDIEWSAGKIAMQIAVYAHSDLYDIETGERTPNPASKTSGLIIHLPVGQANCTLHNIDLVAGWEAVALATKVRAWRKRKDLKTPFDINTVQKAEQVDVPTIAADPILILIDACDSVDQLEGVYQLHMAEWSSVHTNAAAMRKTRITGNQ